MIRMIKMLHFSRIKHVRVSIYIQGLMMRKGLDHTEMVKVCSHVTRGASICETCLSKERTFAACSHPNLKLLEKIKCNGMIASFSDLNKLSIGVMSCLRTTQATWNSNRQR